MLQSCRSHFLTVKLLIIDCSPQTCSVSVSCLKSHETSWNTRNLLKKCTRKPEFFTIQSENLNEETFYITVPSAVLELTSEKESTKYSYFIPTSFLGGHRPTPISHFSVGGYMRMCGRADVRMFVFKNVRSLNRPAHRKVKLSVMMSRPQKHIF